MKRKLIFVLILFFVIDSSVSAQKNKIRFHSINSFALVAGESKYSTAFQTVNGIRFPNWFSGIGIGVDNYHYKTLPLFAEGRCFFGNDKRGFVYGDLGYNFPLNDKPGKEISYYNTYHFTGGIYTDLGIGYQVPLHKKSALSFSLGYNSKVLKTKIEYVDPCLVAPCPVNYSIYNFSFNRMILKAGLIF